VPVKGQRLTELRTRAGLSQVKLAQRADLNPVTVNQIETGAQTDPKLSTLEALAAALGVKVSDLLADPEPETVATFP
jgi:transcriptional regulator with XRE-family HTH domain